MEQQFNSADVLPNVGGYIGSDENYTLDYGVEPIIKHLERFRNRLDRKVIVWCPFDTADSEFVKQISRLDNIVVVYSHIFSGQDFFTWEPEEWDVIISNPPFKDKRKFFDKALSFNKPICLLMTLAWLNDAGSKNVYLDSGRKMQLLMFDKRMKFSNPEGRQNNKITFSSGYFCADFLEEDIVLERLEVAK